MSLIRRILSRPLPDLPRPTWGVYMSDPQRLWASGPKWRARDECDAVNHTGFASASVVYLGWLRPSTYPTLTPIAPPESR